MPGYELTSDEALLFADRVEEPVQAEAPEVVEEAPPEGEKLTITQMIEAAKRSGPQWLFASDDGIGEQ